MQITLNKQPKTVQQDATLLSVISLEGMEDKEGIAVAVNQKVVPKPKWASHVLQAQDTLIIVTATQGG